MPPLTELGFYFAVEGEGRPPTMLPARMPCLANHPFGVSMAYVTALEVLGMGVSSKGFMSWISKILPEGPT